MGSPHKLSCGSFLSLAAKRKKEMRWERLLDWETFLLPQQLIVELHVVASILLFHSRSDRRNQTNQIGRTGWGPRSLRTMSLHKLCTCRRCRKRCIQSLSLKADPDQGGPRPQIKFKERVDYLDRNDGPPPLPSKGHASTPAVPGTGSPRRRT